MFAKRLAELRRERELEQGDLSAVLNIGRSTLSNYERGYRQPDFETLIKVAEFFGVTTDYLLGVSEDRMPKQAPPNPDPENELDFKLSALNLGGADLTDLKDFIKEVLREEKELMRKK